MRIALIRIVGLLIMAGLLSAPSGWRHGTNQALTTQLIPTPFMGWHPWYCCTFGIETEAGMQSIADSLVSTGLAAAGYKYQWLDSGWWDGARDGGGNIIPPAAQWPHGMKAVVDYIHSKGLKAGIYTDAGNLGCGFPPATGAWSQGFIEKDTRQFLAWGFDAIRYDSCGLPGDMKPAYDGIYNTILGIGIPVLYAVVDGGLGGQSAYGWDFASTYANTTYRTGFDLCGSYPFGTSGGGPVSCVWNDFGNAIVTNHNHPGANGPGHWNDPDLVIGYNCSNFDNPGNVLSPPACLSADESQTAFAMWTIFAAPLLLASDPRKLTAPQLAILKNAEAIAISQDPLGVQGILASNIVNVQVWTKTLTGTGNRGVVVLNTNGGAAGTTVTTAMLGLTGTAAFRDVFGGTNLGTTASYTTPSLPGHGSMMLHVTGGTENNANVVQVNVGGGAAAPFVADTNIGGDGTTQAVGTAINVAGLTSPAPQAVYQSARVGFLSGSNYLTVSIETYVPNLVVNATYLVRLHFAENWKTGAGQRKFNVKVNNVPVLADYDVYADAGNQQFKGVIKEFFTVAKQGFVSVDLSRGSVDFPMISGVEVIKQ